MPRRIETAVREHEDKQFGSRMAKARVELANDFAELGAISLAQLRLKKGFSQTELARRIGTSQSHIAKIEAGSVDLYLKTAIRLADALTISLNDLRPVVEINQGDEPVALTVMVSAK